METLSGSKPRLFFMGLFCNGPLSLSAPRYIQLLLVLRAVGEVQVDKRLIWDARAVRLLREVVDSVAVDIYRYLLFKLLGVRILNRVGEVVCIHHVNHSHP